jgi:plastocyanin
MSGYLKTGSVWAAFLIVAALGCGSSSSVKTGTGGAGAGGSSSGTGGAGGSSGSGGAGGGSATAFVDFKPCDAASQYTTTGATIQYGGIVAGSFAYAPNCLKVAAGTSVTFEPANAGTNFAQHFLHASTRGSVPNPITETTSGTTATFAFPTAGFYPFYCEFHGADDGSAMSGVIWVE